MVENIEWFGHAAFRLTGEKIVYIDPRNISDPKPADIVLISHPHDDHFSPDDIKKITGDSTIIVSIPEIVAQIDGEKKTVYPNEKVHIDDVEIEAIPAYNINKSFHSKKKDWVGFKITMNGKKYYYAGQEC